MKFSNEEDFEIERMEAKRWPLSPGEYLFLADALERVGRAKFADEWDSIDPPLTSESEEAFEEWERQSETLERLEQRRIGVPPVPMHLRDKRLSRNKGVSGSEWSMILQVGMPNLKSMIGNADVFYSID